MNRRNDYSEQSCFVNPHKHRNWRIGLLSARKRSHCWANGTAHIKASVLEGKWNRFWCIYISAYQTLTRIPFSTNLRYFRGGNRIYFSVQSVCVFGFFTAETGLQKERRLWQGLTSIHLHKTLKGYIGILSRKTTFTLSYQSSSAASANLP